MQDKETLGSENAGQQLPAVVAVDFAKGERVDDIELVMQRQHELVNLNRANLSAGDKPAGFQELRKAVGCMVSAHLLEEYFAKASGSTYLSSLDAIREHMTDQQQNYTQLLARRAIRQTRARLS
jgi:hypothetical protein